MSEIDFVVEWIEPGSARGAELRATWARFELLVDGEPVTRLSDLSSRSVRNSIYLPLYPLAEWIATNWWFLFFEIEAPGRDASGYFARHNIRSGAEGYALPSIAINPTGGSIVLDWRPVRLPSAHIDFLGEGSARFDALQFKAFLTQLINVVLRRLDDVGVTDTLLQEEWEAITAADHDEVEFCSASAAMGLDPFALDEAAQEQILAIGNLLPAAVSHDFFAAASFPILAEQAGTLVEALALTRNNGADLLQIKELQRAYGRGHLLAGIPWQQGYEFANRVRHDLGLNGQVLVTLSDVANALSLSNRDLESSMFETPEHRAPFDAVVAVNEAGSPGFVISKRREEAVKFAYCRGLFEFLTSAHGEPILVTRIRSERQKRNRAFAAEFLVPASALRERITGDTVGEEEIDDLAAEFGVATHVIFHQIENHRIARVLPT